MKPRSRQLRRGRFSETGRCYLLTSVTHGRAPIFHDFYSGRLLAHELCRAEQMGWVHSLTWVVMPDHFHWLIQLENSSLPRLMHQVKGSSAQSLMRMHGTSCRVWQPGYQDIAVRDERQLLKMARYILANPIRAGLVARVGDYPLWDAVWLQPS